ncbi:glycosyltransferase [Anaerotalea alkaliphila]|uniref:Glycosyltransferase family 4 protein n=1 Tax=Anaerotalea alkaliphila TaxID=2662126 RepID=A0A7X5KM22_9FIRM|nr:glycosyltransferase [Anaerotalea alkaliphila]NDL66509.1 glycosyltransferase family 4 protein [Anaerotalea alkaliphila]
MGNGRKVMLIAYQFPPMGGAGVQRSAKFAKYLKTLGWDPVVVASEGPKGLVDDSLLEDLAGIPIERTPNWNIGEWPKPFNLLGKFIQRKLLVPDAEWIWYRMNRKKVLALVGKHRPDVLYTTSYPYSGHLMGLWVKKEFPQLPWVVDFRDEWTKNPYVLDFGYSPGRMAKERDMERQVVEACDHLVTNSRLMLDGFMEEHALEGKSTVIPNGYDPADFEGLDRKGSGREKMTIAYTGAMYGRRKPDSFLQGLKKAMEEGLVDPSRVEVDFVGHFNKEHRQKVAELLPGLDIVRFHGYMPHRQSIQFLLDADLLLLIVGSGAEAKNFYTGKIFEYIYTDRTILALAPPDGVAAEVIRETKTGVVVEDGDVEAVKEALGALYARWLEGGLVLDPLREAVERYSRRNQTMELAGVFERLLGGANEY